jgi:chemotaxis protein CheC
MPVLERPLTDLEVDALREVANIGAGNAVTSLAAMTGEDYGMTVPTFGARAMDEFDDLLGDPESLSAAVYVPVFGSARGHGAFVFPYKAACRLVDNLMDRPRGETVELGAMERSAITESGNIIVSSFLNALSDMTGLSMPAGVPALAVDMTGAILGTIASASPDLGDHGLTVMTRFSEAGRPVEGVFVFIPEPTSLSTLFGALGLWPRNATHS